MTSGDEDDNGEEEVLNLEDQLGDLDLDLPDEADDSSESEADQPHASTAQSDERPADQPVDAGGDFNKRYEPPKDADVDDQELFERAVSDFDREEARRAKQPPEKQQAQQPEQGLDIEFEPGELEPPDESGGASSGSASEAGDVPSDQEIFEEAVSELDQEDMYRGKFEGEGPSPPEGSGEQGLADAGDTDAQSDPPAHSGQSDSAPQGSAQDEEQARRHIEEKRASRQFEDHVGEVDEHVDSDKRRPRPDRDPAADVQRVTERRGGAAGAGPSADFVTPHLPTSGRGLSYVGALATEHRKLLERFSRYAEDNQVYEVNVRGQNVDEALQQLAELIDNLYENGENFGRVVHGRGLQSDGEPVLKPAVLTWIAEQGASMIRGYAPELNDAGDYGSVVVELATS